MISVQSIALQLCFLQRVEENSSEHNSKTFCQCPSICLRRSSKRVRGCLKSRLRVTDHRRVMPITINTDKLYDTDLTDTAWALIGAELPPARPA